jgi:hypothetical protein
MPITLSTGATMSFWLNTSTETCCDHLELWVDGVLSGQWQGTTAWTQASAAVSAGAHTLEWRYTKDGSVSSGSDAVWIDDVTFALESSPNDGRHSAVGDRHLDPARGSERRGERAHHALADELDVPLGERRESVAAHVLVSSAD